MSIFDRIRAFVREPQADARARRNSALLSSILTEMADELQDAGMITSSMNSSALLTGSLSSVESRVGALEDEVDEALVFQPYTPTVAPAARSAAEDAELLAWIT